MWTGKWVSRLRTYNIQGWKFKIFYLRIFSIFQTRRNFSYRGMSQYEIHIYAKRDPPRLGLVVSASYLYIVRDSMILYTLVPSKSDCAISIPLKINFFPRISILSITISTFGYGQHLSDSQIAVEVKKDGFTNFR